MKVFVDTNVFVYAVDPADRVKQARAREVLKRTIGAGQGVISTQVVAEYTAVASAKLGVAGRADVAAQARLMLDLWEVAPVDRATVASALAVHERHGLSYWDAQILAAAKLAECDVVLTEDLVAPRLLGVEYVNPFAEGFEV